jgi:Ca2+-binding EF-hand superfamily protein
MEAEREAECLFHGMSMEEVEHLIRQAFAEADTDASGELDLLEFQTFLRELPLNLTKREINVAMMEVDANQDGNVSLEEFIPLFQVLMRQMIKNQILRVKRRPDELASFLIMCCQAYDPDATTYIREQKLAHALRKADIGLTKFQILSIVGEAPVGAHGIEYEKFLADTGSSMIRALISAEGSVQYTRTAAWKQIQGAEEEAVMVLGMSRDDFATIMTGIFQAHDLDKSGTLNTSEFEAAIKTCGIPYSQSQIRMLMAAADLNADGLVEYGEFATVAVQLMEYVQREARLAEAMGSIAEEQDEDEQEQALEEQLPQPPVPQVAASAIQQVARPKPAKSSGRERPHGACQRSTSPGAAPASRSRPQGARVTAREADVANLKEKSKAKAMEIERLIKVENAAAAWLGCF